MTEIESERMMRAYRLHLEKWQDGRASFITPAEWMAKWLVDKAAQAVRDRLYAAMGWIEA
jgi:hypothetical protein